MARPQTSKKERGETAAPEALLSGYRVLDLSDEKGLLCAKVLADMGAEVIQVEPPGGSPARLLGPFYQEQPHPGRGFTWLAFCQGKKSITLNLEHPRGREVFKLLAAKADVVVESFPPGYLDSLGLGYDELHRLNPGLVFTSISPFGQEGPYARFKGPDLVVTAMSGYMSLCGDTDRPPVRLSVPFAYPFACAEAAAATMIALYQRHLTGRGQRVDVSAQQVMATLCLNAPAFWEFQERLIKRSGPFRAELTAGEKELQLWRCRDGWVSFSVYGGATGERVNRALVKWMEEEGLADDFLRGIDWGALDMARVTRQFLYQIEERLAVFFRRHTKEELLKGALERRLILLPVFTLQEVLADPQLRARGFWMEVEHPELGRVLTYPGPFVQGHPVPVKPGGRAPKVGEHNREVYEGLLGLSRSQMAELKREGVIG